jgi:hypothetical protein
MDAVDMEGTLTAVDVDHFAAITDPVKVGELMLAIDSYGRGGLSSTSAALRLAPELGGARWEEFFLDAEHPEWRIPGPRMKMDRAGISAEGEDLLAKQ